MTKKDFVLIAGVLRATNAPDHVTQAFADALAGQNPLFQRARFLAEATNPSLHHADTCPVCGGTDIEGDSFDPEGDSVSQHVGCNACGAEWMDVYQLATYTVLA